MIVIHNQIDARLVREAEELLWAEGLLALLTKGALPDGYLPDEDDPAWPSRSGQAD